MTTLSQRSGVTQLEFHQAMSDFKTMFPEMDEDVIEVVLRANNGAVDATIDQLLAMNLDSENERLRQELDTTDNNEVPPRYSPATPPPSYHSLQSQTIGLNSGQNNRLPSSDSTNESTLNEKLSSHMNSATNVPNLKASPSKDSMRYKRQWNPPILGPLPNTFLRIELNENQRKLSALSRPQSQMTVINSALLQQKMEENQRQRQMSISTDDPELAQFLEDERVAIFLQNEEFVRELRRNKDFMSTLELDTIGGDSNGTTGATASATHSDSDAAFKETLKHMGKVSRRKFAQLARLFSRRRRRSFQQLLSEGSANPSSRDNLLLREDQYHEFQNEGSDNEEMRDNPLVLRIKENEEFSENVGNVNNSPLNNNSLRSHHKI